MNNFDWREFLTYAKDIYADLKTVGTDFDGAQEAICRTAISRAYYAVYHAADEFLHATKPDYETSLGEDCHNKVIEAFCDRKDKQLRDLLRKFRDLKTKRRNADYESNCYRKTKPFDELELALNSAEEILAVIDERKLKLLRTKKN